MSKHRNLLFIIIGLVLLLSTIAAAAYAINFLVGKTESILELGSSKKNQEVVRFNLEGLKKLGILK